jgi:hypothetical protein
MDRFLISNIDSKEVSCHSQTSLLFFGRRPVVFSYELDWLINAFTRSLEKDDAGQKRFTFEELRKYFFVNGASQETIDLVLFACTRDGDIRHLGFNIARLASSGACQAYRNKLIECGACGPLLDMVKITVISLTREEMVLLGHRVQLLSPKVAQLDAFKLFLAARDIPEMTDLDRLRFERQLGYGSVQRMNGYK